MRASRHGGQVSEHYIHSVDRVGVDGLVELQGLGYPTARKNLMEQVPAHRGHELHADLKWPVFSPLSWQSHIQVHLHSHTNTGNGQGVWAVHHRLRPANLEESF